MLKGFGSIDCMRSISPDMEREKKAAGLAGGTYGAGFGMIDNASGINFQDWLSPSHYINQFFESHDSATK